MNENIRLVIVVFANAGVFLVVAGRALAEVHIEFFANGFGAGRALDLENNRHDVAFGEFLSGYERSAFGDECDHGRIGSITAY